MKLKLFPNVPRPSEVRGKIVTKLDETRPQRRSRLYIWVWFSVFVLGATMIINVTSGSPVGAAAEEPAVLAIQHPKVIQVDKEQFVCSLSSKWPGSVRRWCKYILAAADKYNIKPEVVAAIIWAESKGNPNAQNKDSLATGLMQVMPLEANAIYGCFGDRPPAKKLKDPEFNINFGVRLLSSYIHSEGRLKFALIKYGNLERYPQIIQAVINQYND